MLLISRALVLTGHLWYVINFTCLSYNLLGIFVVIWGLARCGRRLFWGIYEVFRLFLDRSYCRSGSFRKIHDNLRGDGSGLGRVSLTTPRKYNNRGLRIGWGTFCRVSHAPVLWPLGAQYCWDIYFSQDNKNSLQIFSQVSPTGWTVKPHQSTEQFFTNNHVSDFTNLESWMSISIFAKTQLSF